MGFCNLSFSSLLNLPLICFLCGILATFITRERLPKLPKKIGKFLTVFILFCVGLKGGGPLAESSHAFPLFFIATLCALILWGLFQPFLSFFLLKAFTRVDYVTAAAISASFGSVSVMTFVTAVSFLDQIEVGYQEMLIALLAIMEIPAIISGVFLAKVFDGGGLRETTSVGKILRQALSNKAIITLACGLLAGAFFSFSHRASVSQTFLLSFKPALCLFLFDMGLQVGFHKQNFKSFSWSLNLFAVYMPLIGGFFGLSLSYLLGLDIGTGTLVAVMAASSSYIAVPAAMRIALPQAKEAVYLPLSLGIAFPFNVVIGIPLYYHFAVKLLA